MAKKFDRNRSISPAKPRARVCAPTQAVTPLKVRSISGSQVQIRRQLSTRLAKGCGPYPLPALSAANHGREIPARITRINTGRPTLPPSFLAVAVTPREGRRRLLLVIAHHCAQQLVNQFLSRPPAKASTPFTFFDRGILLQLAALALEDLGQWEADRLQVRGILDTPFQLSSYFGELEGPLWNLDGEIIVNATTIPFTIIGDGDSLRSPIGMPQPNARAVQKLASEIWGRLSLTVGRTLVPAADLRRMEPGDVLTIDALGWPSLPDPTASAKKGEIHLHNDYLALTAQWLDTQKLKISKGPTMSQTTENTILLQPPVATPAAEISVPCEVVAGEMVMTIAQIAALVPGQVIDLGRPVDEAVYIKAGEKLLCKGQLVQVEGNLAVEILEIL